MMSLTAVTELCMQEAQQNSMTAPEQVEAEERKVLTLRPVISKPPGTPPKAQVRLNAAAILREDAVYCRRQQLEAEAIRR